MSGKNKSTRRNEVSGNNYIRILVGSAVSVIMFFVLLALFALFSLKNGANSSLYFPAGVAFALLSGIAGGFAAVRPIKQKGVPYGALSGFISSLFCAAVLFVVNGNKAGSGLFILAGLMLLGGAAGGIGAVNLKFKKKY
ncbi:MAG: TIGR04086 family membrane protein [Ruminococcaceae bacterium]|nr:TIGR04086 family membrane protein [Oscillospiraceae bacterium]